MATHSNDYLRSIRIAVTIFGMFLLQINVLPAIWFLNVKPNLLLISVVVLSSNLAFPDFIAFILLCGLLKDVFSLRLFGFSSFVFTLEAIIIYLTLRYLYKEVFGLKFIILISATVFYYLLLTFILKKGYILIGLEEAIVNCLFLPLVSKVYPRALEPLPK